MTLFHHIRLIMHIFHAMSDEPAILHTGCIGYLVDTIYYRQVCHHIHWYAAYKHSTTALPLNRENRNAFGVDWSIWNIRTLDWLIRNNLRYRITLSYLAKWIQISWKWKTIYIRIKRQIYMRWIRCNRYTDGDILGLSTRVIRLAKYKTNWVQMSILGDK